MSATCQDCGGTGEYLGLIKRERCSACNGLGVTASAPFQTQDQEWHPRPLGRRSAQIDPFGVGEPGTYNGPPVGKNPCSEIVLPSPPPRCSTQMIFPLQVGTIIAFLRSDGTVYINAMVTKISNDAVVCEPFDENGATCGMFMTFPGKEVSWSTKFGGYVVDNRAWQQTP